MQRYQGPVFCQRKVDKKTKHLIDQYFVLWSNWIAIANNTTKVRYECFCFTVVVRILRWFTLTCYITRRFIRLPTCKCTCRYGKKWLGLFILGVSCCYENMDIECCYHTFLQPTDADKWHPAESVTNFCGSVSHYGIYSCVWSRTCSTQSQILLVCVYKSFVHMSFPVDICNNGIRWVTLPPC